MPAQLIVTIGKCARRLERWIDRAAISLPTPLSPVIKTLASHRDESAISDSMRLIVALDPTKLLTSAPDHCRRNNSTSTVALRPIGAMWRKFLY